MTKNKQLVLSLILSFITSLAWGQSPDDDITILSEEAMEVVTNGLQVHEGLFDFFLDHPCELGMQKNCNRPMSSADIGKMKVLIASLEEWRVDAFERIIPRADVLQGLPVEISLGQEHKVEEKTRFDLSTLKYEKYLKITYNPDDSRSRSYVQKARINVVMNLMVFDSFFRMADMLSRAKKIRSILQYDMPEVGAFLNRTYALAMSKERWEKTRLSILFLDEELKLRASLPATMEEGFFHQYIEKSFIAGRMRENDLSYRMSNVLMMDRQLSETKFFESVSRIVGSLSKIFGNTAGQFQSREGKLKVLAKDAQQMKLMKDELRPLDILMEKTPFRLTDRFIPGYYGHVAIWLGSPEELGQMMVTYKGRMIPLLDHPDVLPHLEKISQGKVIVEALREPGVTMNTFEHFMDIDDLLIIRRENIDPNNIGDYVLKTIQQVGKPYDFNFDIETEREIVCSELVYIVFNDEVWPIDRSFGRYTISPDHVAWKGAEGEYETIMMYADGKKIAKGKEVSELRRRLNLPGGIADSPFVKKYPSY